MDIFKSKRFWVAVINVVMMVVTGFVPQLAEHSDIIIPALVIITGFLVGGYTLEDTQALRVNAPVAYGKHKTATESDNAG